MRKNILITGMPRSGKSTVLRKIIADYPDKVGFVTNEVRERDERIGFEIEAYNGRKIMLASIGFSTPYKVSRYFVDVNNLDTILDEVKLFKDNDLLYLDEIGQMELFSKKFKETALAYLNAPNVCVASVSKVFYHYFIEEIKRRGDTILVEITEDNRDRKQVFVERLIGKIMKAQRYTQEKERFQIGEDQATIKTDHGTKRLTKEEDKWNCNCDFFGENNICSHVLALEEILTKIN